jgi:trans-aconitate 2-methyltransferase
MPSPWDPVTYTRFRSERSQPFFDLLGMVRRRTDMRIVDLGCGTGELTRHMHETLAARTTVGIDSSETMLAEASSQKTGGLSFCMGDIGALDVEPSIAGLVRGTKLAKRGIDLLFSNAALHWVDGHADLLERLAQALADGGQLAVQVPANFDHPSHTVAAEVAKDPLFAAALGHKAHRAKVLAPEAYATLLFRLGFREQTVRLHVYPHVLATRDEVVTWVQGTLLTDYRARLPEALYEQFVATYRARLFAALPDEQPFFFPYKRILFWASR